MKFFHRIVNLFRDSPTYGRDRASLMSGVMIGSTALILNVAVLFMLLPLMLDPNDRDFRDLTENVEFGQLLSLILLGGATAFATFLIPLRLLSVFWGPRIGRYFDQIVLSGITPLKFVIGKVTSQNLFLILIAVLLLPYLVLSLALGGVKPAQFLAGLFLVWQYCMMLSILTLWASLYLNELLAAVVVAGTATMLSVLGCMPIPFQPFVVTPFPALIHPILKALPFLDGFVTTQFWSVFFSCSICMAVLSIGGLFAIHMGPLYGIIRDNSTFGEVVRSGDSKRKRWLRLRLHIQRPSELAFFYENAVGGLRRFEGLIRWGATLGGLLLLLTTAYVTFGYLIATYVLSGTNVSRGWWLYDFHTTYLVIHAVAMTLGVLLFCHARNTTYLRIPFAAGRQATVSRLDTAGFLIFLAVATAAVIGMPHWFERNVAAAVNFTLFPDSLELARNRPVDFSRIALVGSLIISTSAVVLYLLNRLLCLWMWLRSLSFLVTAVVYVGLIGLLPILCGTLFLEVSELREIHVISDHAPTIMLISPFSAVVLLFNELGPAFPADLSTAPFFVVHGVFGCAILGLIHRRSRNVRPDYLANLVQEAQA